MMATREKQLTVWRDLILQYCRLNNIHVLLPHTFPYFKNDAIDRQLSKEGVDAVIDFLIKSGNDSICLIFYVKTCSQVMPSGRTHLELAC